MLNSKLLRHPLTGQPILPLGTRKDGRLIWPILGGSGEGGDGGEGGKGGTGGDDAAAEAEAAKKAAEAEAAKKAAEAKGGEGAEGKPETFDRAYVEKLRKENADHRTKAKAAEDRAAAILKAAGLEPDEGQDPVKVAEAAAKERDEARDRARVTEVQLAVFKAAPKLQGDGNALLDSNSFLAKVKDLDPTADDFATKVDDAIKAAIQANPKFKLAPAAGRSGAEINGGSGEGTTRPKSIREALNKANA